MQPAPEFVHIPYAAMENTFFEILQRHQYTPEKAKACATLFATNSLEGVYTHGVNRFARFVTYTQQGHIDPAREAVLKHAAGALEQWDGQRGPGPLNARISVQRAMTLARQHGIGCVALANTNHWMRGGAYGWEAAKQGFVFIGWTNTIANMPAWGGVDVKLGNNPLVMAVPYYDEAIVLDTAMSQYSYGALDFYLLKNQQLPVPGGYTSAGELTTDPAAIRESQRTLPIGYWKGSGLSLLLDILAAILSGGLSTSGISKQNAETNISQVFIAIDLKKLGNFAGIAAVLDGIVADVHASVPVGSKPVLYPGERVVATRAENNAQGIPVLKNVWEEIMRL